MFPVLFAGTWWEMPTWYLVVATSVVICHALLARRLAAGVDPNLVAESGRAFLLALAVGLFCARLGGFYEAEETPQMFLAQGGFGAMSSVPGLVGVLLWAGWRYRHCPATGTQVLHLLAPVGVLGLGLGRLGCFLAGCDYGVSLTELGLIGTRWWAVVGGVPPVPRVPVQLLEAVLLGGVAALTCGWRWQAAAQAQLGWWAVLGWGVVRGAAECWRADPRWSWRLGETTWSLGQGAAVAAVLGAAFGLWRQHLHKLKW